MSLRGVPVFEKFPEETFTQSVDFSGVLAEGESISACDVSAIDRSSGEDASAEILSGSATVAGNTVEYEVTGGQEDARYLIVVSATVLGGVYAQWIEMRVPKRTV